MSERRAQFSGDRRTVQRGPGRPENRPDHESSSWRRHFGRIDPFCWAAVGPLLLIAVVSVWGQFPPLAIGVVAIALLLLAGDSWINRPRTATDRDSRRPRGGRR